jgi:hypothetical protein
MLDKNTPFNADSTTLLVQFLSPCILLVFAITSTANCCNALQIVEEILSVVCTNVSTRRLLTVPVRTEGVIV